MFQANSFI